MTPEEAARKWMEELEFNRFVPLNKKQIEIVKGIYKDYDVATSNYIFKVTSIGIMKIDNESNPDNYDLVSGIAVPRRDWLAEIISREHPEYAETLRERNKQIKKAALRRGLIL